jgi:hypothetical protein
MSVIPDGSPADMIISGPSCLPWFLAGRSIDRNARRVISAYFITIVRIKILDRSGCVVSNLNYGVEYNGF